jgi:hypothetical protein
LESFGETHHITPGSDSDLPSIVPLTCNCAFIRRQADNIQNANSDEISIIHLASLVGWDNAEELAAAMGLKSGRPLRALANGVS